MTVTVLTAAGPTTESAIAAVIDGQVGVRLVRRCPDLADVLAMAQAGRVQVAVLGMDLVGLDRSAVAQVMANQVGVVGVFDANREDQQRIWMQWGVSACLPIDAPAADFAEAIVAQSHGVQDSAEPAADSVVGTIPAVDDAPDDHSDAPGADEESAGTVIAVWGPVGSPGRTTLAVNLAAELALQGHRTVLVDADTYGASIAQHVALLDEAPGVAAATRLADAGHLDRMSLSRVAPEVSPNLRVLSGLPRADRWPELRSEAFTEVLHQCRSIAQFTVVDVAAPLEQDEDLSYDTTAPQRNALTLAAVRNADLVLVVGSGDPVGLQRLVRTLPELTEATSAPTKVVIAKVRASAVGNQPGLKVAEALQRFASVADPVLVPDDRVSLDQAMLAGRWLHEVAPNSEIRAAYRALAGDVSGTDAPALSRRGRRAARFRVLRT